MKIGLTDYAKARLPIAEAERIAETAVKDAFGILRRNKYPSFCSAFSIENEELLGSVGVAIKKDGSELAYVNFGSRAKITELYDNIKKREARKAKVN